MKSSEKKMILILILVGVIIIAGISLWKNNKSKDNNNNDVIIQKEENETEEYVQKLEDGSKLNVSEELRKTKTLDGLEITNIQLKEIAGITTLLADVENKTGAKTSSKKVKVDILDKSGNTIVTLKGRIDEIKARDKVKLNMAVTADVSNAYDFRISNY